MPRKSARKPSKGRKSKTKKRSVRKANIRRISIIAFLFISSTLFLSLYTLKKFINQNFVSADSISSYSFNDASVSSIAYIVVDTLSEGSDITVKEIDFLVMDKESKKAIRYSLPIETVLDFPGEFGNAELCKSFLISSLNSEDVVGEGITLIRSAITRVFGFKVDRYLLITEDTLKDKGNILYEERLLSILDLDTIINGRKVIRSDMTLSEFSSTRSFLMGLPSDRVIDRIVEDFTPDTQLILDDELRDMTFEAAVSQERLSIAILNGTNLPGLAMFGSRVVNNLGGRVVALNNSDKPYENSYIITKDDNFETVSQLVHTFGVSPSNVVLREDAYEFTEDEIRRSDIVVILGFDTANKIY